VDDRRNRLLVFAGTVFVWQQLPAFSGDTGTWIDLATPFFVIGTAAWALRDASMRVIVFALVAGVLYVDGHGIHLSANDLGHQHLTGHAQDVRFFWDERFGHIEWHLGWLGLLAALALADTRPGGPRQPDLVAVALLGWSLFVNTVEGGDWFLTVAAAPVFALWAVRRRGPTLIAIAAAAAIGASLIGVWALWHGGVPQFSDLGWI
jgi:hypothetical protein